LLKVLDFGIAKLTDAPSRRDGKVSGALTGENASLGSPSYMSPEQVRDARHIDSRADVWALGTILYEMLAGREAFGGGSVGEIFAAVLHSAPAPLRELRPDVPEPLEAAIVQCLQRAPDERFQDVAQLAQAISPYGTGAFSGYVDRIEQTLTRSGRTSNPESKGRVSRPDTPVPSSGRRRLSSAAASPTPDAFSRTSRARAALSGADTQPTESGRRPKPSSRRAATKVLLGVGLGASLVIVAAVGFVRSRPSSEADAPATAKALASGAMVTASSASANPTAPAASAPSSAPASPAPVAPTGRVKAAQPARPRAPTSKATASGVPGILDSPN